MDRVVSPVGEPRAVTDPPTLRVAYVTMRYPVASETFATNDVRTLAELGVRTEVLPLRAAAAAAPAILASRGVEHVPVVPTERLVRLGWASMRRTPIAALGDLAWFLRTSLFAPRALLAGLWLWPAAVGAAAHVIASGHDVVHLRWGHHPSLVGALLRRRAARAVVSVSLSAYDLVARVPVSRWLVPRADVVRTVAQANVATIRQAYGRGDRPVLVIHDAVPDEVLDGDPGPKQRGLVATAARLLPGKRVDRVIEAFAMALPGLPPEVAALARLDVLGDGPERATLETLARDAGLEERVRFRGMVPYPEVLATLRRAEAFVFLSDIASERLPNVVKEALACRCAVVASRTEGIEELIAPERSGVLVDAADVDGAAAALARMLADPVRAAGLGEAGREQVGRAFRLSASGHAYLDAWQRAQRERGQARG